MAATTNRGGFALPMAILLIGLITAGVVAAFARTTAETNMIDNSAVEALAFTLAQAGLDRAVAAGDTGAASAGSPCNTVAYTLTGGSASVRRCRLRAATSTTDTAIWLFRSTGTATTRRARATRDVAQVIYKSGGSMQVLSSWTSLSGINKAGASGDITGEDECGSGTTLPGVQVPDGGFTGHSEAISGDPAIDYGGTQTEMASTIKIDWVGLTSPSAPAATADYVYCQSGTYGYISGYTCNGWPSSSLFSNPDFWPTIIINGSSALPGDGRGLLIVSGDLTFGGGDNWDGIILVGGKITDNGSGDISGAVVSGLNVLKGMTVGESSKANGTKDYAYNSCEVAKAANSLSKVQAVKNAWMDNWPGW